MYFKIIVCYNYEFKCKKVIINCEEITISFESKAPIPKEIFDLLAQESCKKITVKEQIIPDDIANIRCNCCKYIRKLYSENIEQSTDNKKRTKIIFGSLCFLSTHLKQVSYLWVNHTEEQ